MMIAAILPSTIDVPRALVGFAMGVLVCLDVLTVYHYGWMHKLGKETSPPYAVALLRGSYAVLCLYVFADLIARWGTPISWRFLLAILAIGAGLPGTLAILHYCREEHHRRQQGPPK